MEEGAYYNHNVTYSIPAQEICLRVLTRLLLSKLIIRETRPVDSTHVVQNIH